MIGQREVTKLEELPSSIQDVAEALGLPIVIKLVRHFGGAEISIPKKMSAGHPLRVALGKEDAEALAGYLGNSQIYVPMMKRSRVRDVLALEAKGRNRTEIALALGMSQRHVRRLASKHVDDRQIDLFK